MASPPSPQQLLEAWSLDRRQGDHARLAALLAATGEVDPADLGDDTLGQRHWRLLALHRAVIGAPMEAMVACGHCAAKSEFVVPAEAILAAPRTDPKDHLVLRIGRREFTFRLPRMSDLAAVAGLEDAKAVQERVAQRCLAGGGDVPRSLMERLERGFEALDPAANIVVNIDCSGCGQAIAASVDLAGFVARDLDRLVDGLIRDIDVVAGAYGWSEDQILALPPARRARYVALIANARNLARPALAEGWA